MRGLQFETFVPPTVFLNNLSLNRPSKLFVINLLSHHFLLLLVSNVQWQAEANDIESYNNHQYDAILC
jgi:hypothetical protein